MKDISGDECFNILDISGYILYYFTATWCKPCQMIAQEILDLSEKYNDTVSFFKIDISNDDNDEICKKCLIESVPSFLLFKDREFIERVTGSNISKVEQLINTKCI
tara:strand:+ start:540 stop:857 length:318 start_codon:yes stop_codon:yes gene_type:complete